MSIDDGPNSIDWVPLGNRACGLVFGGRIVALIYWQGPRSGEDHAHSDGGFWWVPAELPVDHFWLFAASDPGKTEWALARERAVDAYLEWAPREAAYDAALRREAAEVLSARLRQDGRLRERPLMRAWSRARSDQDG
jgi:hypothetical protein